MYEAVEGIREEELSSLSIEIMDYADRISEIFDKIDSCAEKIPTYYHGQSSRELMKAYKSLSSNYSVIVENIRSYSDDLVALIRKLRENDKTLSILFQEFTDNTKNKTKLIN